MPAAVIRPAGAGEVARLCLLGALWGSAFLCIEVALRSFSPLQIAAYRVALGAKLLCAVVLWRRLPWPRSWRLWLWLALIGALNSALPF